ncbi:MAG: Hpt domain-containing protein, partial [Nitrospirae bacterium]|nr:Hpt domain-containing protein [Nitrospirota bacterium]
DYIIKPVDAAVLVDKVGRILRSTPPVFLDKEHVMSKLKIGEDTYKEMLDVLSQRGTSAVQEMNGFIKSGDYEKLLCVVVGLKGGAMSLGAERLSNILKRMEDVVKGQKGDEIQDMICAVQREVNIIKSFLQ